MPTHRPVLIAEHLQALLPGLTLTLCCLGTLLPLSAGAQDAADLSRLIFEPVALAEAPDGRLFEISELPGGEVALELSTLLDEEAGDDAASLAALQDDVARYEESIRVLEREGGAYEGRLGQELLGLGTLYQRLGDHTKALEVFERAWHVSRVNNGLFSLDQAPIVQKIIESRLASGDLAAADQQQEYLFFIQQRAHGAGSPELLPALAALADWNIGAFNVRFDGGQGDDPQYRVSAGADDGFLARRLVNAQNLYRAIIAILANHAGVADPLLLDVEKKLALTNYFFATNHNLASSSFITSGAYAVQSIQPTAFDASFLNVNAMGYRHGRDALERRVDYLRKQDGVDARTLARAIVDLGDWLLIFDKRTSAVDTYEEATEALSASSTSPAWRDLLAPSVPVALPTFIHHRFTRGARGVPADVPLRYKGHLDVAFTVNRYGQPGAVDVLDKSPAANETIESALVRHLRRSVFRPRFDATGAAREHRAMLRYYFTY